MICRWRRKGRVHRPKACRVRSYKLGGAFLCITKYFNRNIVLQASFPTCLAQTASRMDLWDTRWKAMLDIAIKEKEAWMIEKEKANWVYEDWRRWGAKLRENGLTNRLFWSKSSWWNSFPLCSGDEKSSVIHCKIYIDKNGADNSRWIKGLSTESGSICCKWIDLTTVILFIKMWNICKIHLMQKRTTIPETLFSKIS